jgi:xylitol oxidase
MMATGGDMLETTTNWGGNIAYSASRLVIPGSVDELAEVVRASARVKPLGTRHTFNLIADTPGTLISMRKLDAVVGFDADARTVSVEPGITYGQLGRYLDERGFALTNLPSLPHVSVGGAVQTATHGSGTANLSSDVVAIQLLTADGERIDVDPTRATVSLGLFGIVTRLTLRIRPTFQIQQDVYEQVPLDALADAFEQVTTAAYSVSFFTDWQNDHVNQVWFKRKPANTLPDFDFLRGRLAKRKVHPIPDVDPVNCTEQGSPGPWHERLPHFRHDREPSSAGQELQAEYFVKRSDAPAALRAVAAVGPRLREVIMTSEVREVMADQQWLSPAYRQDVVGIHFTMQPTVPEVLEALTNVIEPALAPFKPRPHWGKLFTLDPSAVQSGYPMLPQFAALAKQLDPGGKFRNAFADRFVFGTTT